MTDERPSKKQKEVFDYIDGFISENGFGPSYREVMRALGLKSVSTVATHVDGLIVRGLLVKRENSARSLQVVLKESTRPSSEVVNTHLEWLRKEIARRETNDNLADEAKTLNAALEILAK